MTSYHLEYLDPFLLCHNQILPLRVLPILLMMLLMLDSPMLLQYQIDVLPMEGLFPYIRNPFFEITTINTAAFLAQSLLTSASKLKNLFQSSALTVFLFA